jgi:hypothetical protein
MHVLCNKVHIAVVHARVNQQPLAAVTACVCVYGALFEYVINRRFLFVIYASVKISGNIPSYDLTACCKCALSG